jgi:nucleotide-binding universal stress UspA family protein
MFEKLLLAVDGSEHARHAIPLVADLAKKSAGHVTVLHVREHGVSKFTEWERETADDAQSVVEGVQRELLAAGAESSFEIRRALAGRAAREICDVADELDADLVVVGNHGRNALVRLVLGSTSTYVVHHCRRPVMVVRDVHDDEPDGRDDESVARAESAVS